MSGDFRLEDLPGVGKITAEKLRKAGIDNVRILAIMNPEEIEAATGMDVVRAQRIIMSARRLVGLESEILTAEEYEKQSLGKRRLSTGVKSLDELLGGGLEPGSIYEFAGEYGSGKTQLCHQIAVMAQLPPEKGGLAAKVLYIDTEGTFSPSRIRSIAEYRGVDDALRNIYVSRVESVVSMEEVIVNGTPRLIEDKGVRVVIIDSIIALYRAQFRGVEFLARRQQRINYILDWLKRIGRVYGEVYFVITNQVLTNVGGFASIKIPAGGNIIAHASTHRFILRKAKETFLLMVLDSPRLPKNATVEMRIDETGVHDA